VGAKGTRPSGRFNDHHARDILTSKTMRSVKRRKRRAPPAWLWPRAIFTSEFGFNAEAQPSSRRAGGRTRKHAEFGRHISDPLLLNLTGFPSAPFCGLGASALKAVSSLCFLRFLR
jgi:hypothetical protein